MTDKQKKAIITIVICLFIVMYSSLLLTARDLREADTLNLRNATDSLILLTELTTESSGDCALAKADHIEMLRKYVEHMENRYKPQVFVPRNNIAKKLKLVIKKLEKDGTEANQQTEACAKIKIASKTIAEFLNKHKLFISEPIIGSEFEVVPEKMQNVIKDLLDEAHKKTEIYVNDLSVVNSEMAYRANRKVIVYLYLVRSEWLASEIITWKEFKNFRGDINRTIFWNRILKRSLNEYERSWLTICSSNELRHLRLLNAIIDNDMKEAHLWLQIVIKEAFPDMQFLAKR